MLLPAVLLSLHDCSREYIKGAGSLSLSSVALSTGTHTPPPRLSLPYTAGPTASTHAHTRTHCRLYVGHHGRRLRPQLLRPATGPRRVRHHRSDQAAETAEAAQLNRDGGGDGYGHNRVADAP